MEYSYGKQVLLITEERWGIFRIAILFIRIQYAESDVSDGSYCSGRDDLSILLNAMGVWYRKPERLSAFTFAGIRSGRQIELKVNMTMKPELLPSEDPTTIISKAHPTPRILLVSWLVNWDIPTPSYTANPTLFEDFSYRCDCTYEFFAHCRIVVPWLADQDF